MDRGTRKFHAKARSWSDEVMILPPTLGYCGAMGLVGCIPNEGNAGHVNSTRKIKRERSYRV